MNLLHMRYAVEVARLGSLNKASETLMTAQPNISRSIKELESELGITIFQRSAKGMSLTPDGEEFMDYARDILFRMDKIEQSYRDGEHKKRKFSVCAPRTSYVSAAMAEFSKSIGDAPVEIYYKETDLKNTVQKILDNEYNLGIIRYSDVYDKYYKSMLEEKGLCFELVAEISGVLLMSRENPLASCERITHEALFGYIEIAYADNCAPSPSVSKTLKEEPTDKTAQKIFVFERASRLELLSENSRTFAWDSPASQQTLDRYKLVQRSCDGDKRVYKDLLIYQKGYNLTRLDRDFITALCESKRKLIR